MTLPLLALQVHVVSLQDRIVSLEEQVCHLEKARDNLAAQRDEVLARSKAKGERAAAVIRDFRHTVKSVLLALSAPHFDTPAVCLAVAEAKNQLGAVLAKTTEERTNEKTN